MILDFRFWILDWKKKRNLFLLASLMVLSGCMPMPSHQDFENVGLIEGKGRVVFVDLEGGFYGIESDDGHRYDITNMPKEFQEHGRRVLFQGRLKEGDMSTHMWGIMMVLEYIKRDVTKDVVPRQE